MLSPGNNVGKKVGRTTTLRLFESFRPPFSKGGAHPRRVALVALRRGRNPLYGIFFLLSFFFCACYGQKKKRRSLFADIISVYEAAFSAAPSGREPPLRRYRGSSRSYTEPPTQRGIRKQKYPVRNNLTGFFYYLFSSSLAASTAVGVISNTFLNLMWNKSKATPATISSIDVI